MKEIKINYVYTTNTAGPDCLLACVEKEPQCGNIIGIPVFRGDFENEPSCTKVAEGLYAAPVAAAVHQPGDFVEEVCQIEPLEWKDAYEFPEFDTEAGQRILSYRSHVYTPDVWENGIAFFCGERDPNDVLDQHPELVELGFQFVDSVGNLKPCIMFSGGDLETFEKALDILGRKNIDYHPDCFDTVQQMIDYYNDWHWKKEVTNV